MANDKTGKLRSKAVIVFPDRPGGVREVCLSLAEGLQTAGFQVHCLTTVRAVIGFLCKHVWTLSEIPCITNLHYGWVGLLFRRSVFIVHGFPLRTETPRKYRFIVAGHRLFSWMNRRTVAVSYLIKFVLENFHSTNVDGVIHNVLPSDFWRAAQTPIVAHSGAPRLVYCGRVIRGKGVETILRAADALRARGRVLGVDVIGSGYFLDELKRVYRHPDNIFHGYVLSGEKYRIMSEAHSFVSLHPAEPFGITTLEAFTLGLNCCVSSLGGHNEVIAKEAIFRINDPGDYLEVAAVVEQSISIERKHYNRSDVNGVQYFREYAERFLKLLGPV